MIEAPKHLAAQRVRPNHYGERPLTSIREGVPVVDQVDVMAEVVNLESHEICVNLPSEAIDNVKLGTVCGLIRASTRLASL